MRDHSYLLCVFFAGWSGLSVHRNQYDWAMFLGLTALIIALDGVGKYIVNRISPATKE